MSSWAKDHIPPDLAERIFRDLVSPAEPKAQQNGSLLASCPLDGHEDKNPSFVFFPDSGKWRCYSHPGGEDRGDIVDLYARVRGTGDFVDTAKAICRDYGLPGDALPGQAGNAPSGRASSPQDGRGKQGAGKGKGEKKKRRAAREDEFIAEETLAALAPLPENWLAALAAKRGWSRETMAALGLRLWVGYNGEERVAIPIRDEAGRLVNIRKYRPGAPKGEKIKSWYEERAGEIVLFGEARLFPHPAGLPAAEALWLVEGEPDCIAARSAGLNAATATGGAGTWKSPWSAALAGRDVVVCYDADAKGEEGAERVAHLLAPFADRVRLVFWPGWMKAAGHDLTDFLVTHGKTAEDLKALAEKAVEMEPPEIADDDSWLYEAAPDRFCVFSTFDGKPNYRAMLLVQDILKEHRLVTEPKTGQTFRFDGAVWRPLHLAEIKQMAVKKLGLAAGRTRVDEAAGLVQSQTMLPMGEEMNPAPQLIACQNGVVDVLTWRVRPHHHKYRLTHLHPWEFDPRTPVDCPQVKRFLRQVVGVPQVIREIQMFMGYCFLHAYPYHKVLFLVGKARSGKSTFLGLLQHMVGDEFISNVDWKDLEDQHLRAVLDNKKINVFTEAAGNFYESGHFKALSGDDFVMAAHKHRDPFRFKFRGKLLFSANRLPSILDPGNAIVERMLPVVFSRPKGAPQVGGLGEQLAAEAAGVFQWALVGLALLRQRGHWRHSAATRALLAEYRKDLNPVERFIDEQCRVQEPGGPVRMVKSGDLHAAYEEWAKAQGFKPMGAAVFGKKLLNLDSVQVTKDKDWSLGNVYKGLDMIALV